MNAASNGNFMTQSLKGAYKLIKNIIDSSVARDKEYDRSHKVNSIDQTQIDELNEKLNRLLTAEARSIRFSNPEPRPQTTNASSSQDKLTLLVEQLVLDQKMTNQRIEAMYADLNGKIEAIIQKMDPPATQQAKTIERQHDQKEPCKMIQGPREQLNRVEKLMEQLMINRQESDERWEKLLAEESIEPPLPMIEETSEQQDTTPTKVEARPTPKTIGQPERVYTPPIPYPVTPKHLRPSISPEKLAGFQKMVRRLPKNISFEEAWEDRPLWTFFKDCRETQEDVKALFHEVRGKTPQLRTLQKKGDPGQFVVPFSINGVKFEDTLCDTGSSINLMSKDLADQLQLTDLQPSRIRLAFADSSTTITEGKLVDVNIQIGNCLVPTDFQVVKMKNASEAPLLLGRPFMATAGALLDLPRSRISFLNINRRVFYDALSSPGQTQRTSCIWVIKTENRPSLPPVSKKALTRQTVRNPKLQPPDTSWRSSHHFLHIRVPIPHEIRSLKKAKILDKMKSTLNTFPDITWWEIDKDALTASTS